GVKLTLSLTLSHYIGREDLIDYFFTEMTPFDKLRVRLLPLDSGPAQAALSCFAIHLVRQKDGRL
ncbi:MAG: hypothetical protein OEY19_05710, partial [Gammaproteobacteria bacterium]|nr:hypothetical protein [Gammaproteobacteria bacterium]